MSRESGRPPEPRPEDVRAGARPAALFALALAVLTGGAAVVVFVVGLRVVDTFIVVEPGPTGLLTGAAVWLGFWVGLSAGLIGGLGLGYRAWRRYAHRRSASRREASAAA